MLEGLKRAISKALRNEPKEVLKEEVKFDFAHLCVRLGSELVVKDNTGLIYGSSCVKPATTIISAIGIVKIHRSTLYRLYLGNEYFVQIIILPDNSIEECRLYRLVKIEQPSTAQEWEKWLLSESRANRENKSIGIIGGDEYILNDTSYLRLESWASPEPVWVEPVEFFEKRHCLGNTQEIHSAAMAYGRWLNEENQIAEYLIISSEELADSSEMHYNVQKDCSIRFYVGIDISFDNLISSF